MRDLDPFTASPRYTTPADAIALRLAGCRPDSTMAATFARWLVARIGAERARNWLNIAMENVK